VDIGQLLIQGPEATGQVGVFCGVRALDEWSGAAYVGGMSGAREAVPRDERAKLRVAANDEGRPQRSNPVIAPDLLTRTIED
jgi:hypothetical protein